MSAPDYRNIEQDTLKNECYRQVVYTVGSSENGAGMQLVLMSLQVGETIPCEVHGNVGAQFIRIESGNGQVTVSGRKYKLHDGVSIMIPNGTQHCIENTDAKKKLKLYSLYTPPEHAATRRDVRQPSEKKTAPPSTKKSASVQKRKRVESPASPVKKRHRMVLRK